MSILQAIGTTFLVIISLVVVAITAFSLHHYLNEREKRDK